MDPLELAAMGWPIFPLRGKKPACAHGFYDATTDPDQIMEWAKRPNVGWATPTGLDRVVVDIDVELAIPEWLREILTAHEGPRVRTGSGTAHYYYRPPEDLRTRIRFLAGADFKARGGYAVIPPSRHPDTGMKYLWIVGPEAELLELPERILESVATRRTTLPSYEVIDSPRYARVLVENALETVATAAEGARNHVLNRASYRLGHYLAARKLVAHEVKERLLDAAITAGLDEQEATRTIESGLVAGIHHYREAK